MLKEMGGGGGGGERERIRNRKQLLLRFFVMISHSRRTHINSNFTFWHAHRCFRTYTKNLIDTHKYSFYLFLYIFKFFVLAIFFFMIP